jgi:hypothetical protein
MECHDWGLPQLMEQHETKYRTLVVKFTRKEGESNLISVRCFDTIVNERTAEEVQSNDPGIKRQIDPSFVMISAPQHNKGKSYLIFAPLVQTWHAAARKYEIPEQAHCSEPVAADQQDRTYAHRIQVDRPWQIVPVLRLHGLFRVALAS